MSTPIVTQELQTVVDSLITEHNVVCKFGTDAAYQKSKDEMTLILKALALQHGVEAVEYALIMSPEMDATTEGL